MNVILVGTDDALMEGLAQSFASSGLTPHVTTTLMDAYEVATNAPPIVAVIERDIAVSAPGDAMAIRLASGGSIVLYRGRDEGQARPIPPSLQRAVLAELTLPLERARLVALTAHVSGRAITTGRSESVYHPPLEVRP